MINKQENLKVNNAWNRLYQRLERDGLLPNKQAHPSRRRSAITRASVVRWISFAAVIMACIIGGRYLKRKTHLPDETLLAVHNEANSPTLATMLEDGSVVYLSEQSSLTYPAHFADDKREVILQGEAFFDIKKQSERPFMIETSLAGIEVTGTSFKINSEQNLSFVLSVFEGEVRVTQKSNKQSLFVKTGETVFFDAQQLILKKSEIGFDDFFKFIHFKDEELINVATIINNHSKSIKLIIEPTIEKRITFTFRVDGDMNKMVEAICLALDLHYLQQDNTIYLSNK